MLLQSRGSSTAAQCLVTGNNLDSATPVSAQFNASDLDAIKLFQSISPDAEIVAVGEEKDFEIMSLSTFVDRKSPRLARPHRTKFSTLPK